MGGNETQLSVAPTAHHSHDLGLSRAPTASEPSNTVLQAREVPEIACHQKLGGKVGVMGLSGSPVTPRQTRPALSLPPPSTSCR